MTLELELKNTGHARSRNEVTLKKTSQDSYPNTVTLTNAVPRLDYAHADIMQGYRLRVHFQLRSTP